MPAVEAQVVVFLRLYAFCKVARKHVSGERRPVLVLRFVAWSLRSGCIPSVGAIGAGILAVPAPAERTEKGLSLELNITGGPSSDCNRSLIQHRIQHKLLPVRPIVALRRSSTACNLVWRRRRRGVDGGGCGSG